MKRVDSAYFAIKIKRTERKKHEKTKARKHNHSWASAEIFPGGAQRRHFVRRFQIAVEFSINSKLCELYNKYTILSKYEQNTHFIQIASCLCDFPLFWNVASARE